MATDTTQFGTEAERECAKRALVVALVLCLLGVVVSVSGFWAVVARVFVLTTLGTIVLIGFFCSGVWDSLAARMRPDAPEAGVQDLHPPVIESAEEAEIASAFAEQPESLSDAHHAPAPVPDTGPDIVPVPPAEPDPILPAPVEAAEIAEIGPQDAQPAGLSAARGGTPDDLKEIKGVGPKLEALLHDLGIYHFDQIAAWGPAEVAWMDSNLAGFKGRVTRDGWVDQARDLARGTSA